VTSTEYGTPVPLRTACSSSRNGPAGSVPDHPPFATAPTSRPPASTLPASSGDSDTTTRASAGITPSHTSIGRSPSRGSDHVWACVVDKASGNGPWPDRATCAGSAGSTIVWRRVSTRSGRPRTV
jgi:hypothetical protein